MPTWPRTTRDHPRVCGEHDPPVNGSDSFVWIIPAYAGNTDGVFYVPGTVWDHPRVCGEHTVSMVVYATMLGSSPRMRGTPGTRYHVRHYAGIIPAYAGNTLQQTVADDLQADHPRVCGEHRWSSRRHSTHPGSSPRMRGTLFDERFRADGGGIIPAYAGNTVTHSHRHSHRRDHPRICGEHLFGGTFDFCHMGSSPRMRGTHDVYDVTQGQYGIIPAYAGNTPDTLNSSSGYWDHPRVCGEHDTTITNDGVATGSSPRMRGTPRFPTTAAVGRGIIPAYAGNTPCLMYSLIPYRDHPRVCGEHAEVQQNLLDPWGSSPRMRGTRCLSVGAAPQ